MLKMLHTICITQAILLNATEISNQETAFYVPQLIPQCFGNQNILTVNIDIGEICVILNPLDNSNCKKFPQGVYADIKFDNLPESVVRGISQTFNYKNTQQICFTCPEIGGKADCEFVQQSQVAVLELKSLTKRMIVPIGQLIISHSEYKNCYNSSDSQFFFDKNQVKIVLQRTFKCQDSRNLFEVFGFKLKQTDGQIIDFDVMGTNSDGNFIFDVSEKNGHIEIVIHSDFSNYYQNSYDELRILLKTRRAGIQIVRQVEISLIQSYELGVMYQNPVFTVSADRFDVVADPLPNAAELDAKYCQKIRLIRLRYQVFNKVTGETLSNLFFTSSSFTFQSIKRGIKCDNAQDGGECTALLKFLQEYDIYTVDILVHYYFYNSIDEMYLYASNLITHVENICWNSIEAYYMKGKVCGVFQANPYSKQCQYLTAQDTEISIKVGDLVLMKRMNYSTQMSMVCIHTDSTRLQSLYKQNSTVSFKFQSDERDLVIEASKSFNSDYSELTSRIFIFGIVSGSLFVGMIVFYIIRYKMGMQWIVKKKIKVIEIDEI